MLGRVPRVAGQGALGIPGCSVSLRPSPLPTNLQLPAGEGLSLLAGDYTQPMSFTGIMNFAKWGLRLLVRTVLS